MQNRKVAAWLALAACGATGATVYAQDKAPKKANAQANAQKPDKAPVSAPEKATLDKPVKEFKLKDVARDAKPGEKADAADVALSSYKDKKAVVLFFMSEKCDVTWRYEKRVGQLQSKFGKDIAFLGVRCSALDTCDSIRKFAEAKNFDMPILNDEKGQLASYFKIVCTPSFALIDKKGVLRYFGSFDDAAEEPEVKKRLLPDAVSAVLTDKVVSIKTNRPFG